MLKYTKYITWRIAGPMILICFSLTVIVWLSQSLRFIDFIVNRGLSIGTFLYLSSLTLPSLLWIIIPISLFISILFAYNKLTNESELIVLKSAGINRWGLMKPAIFFATIATLASYLISLYLLPASYREFKDMQSFIRDNYASLLLQESVFVSPTPGLTVYIRERDSEGTLHNIIVHDERKKGKRVTMMAQNGQLLQSATGPRFLLISGNRQEFDTDTGALSLLYFERYSLELGLLNTTIPHRRWREPEERYIEELFYPHDATTDAAKQKLRAEGHHRITWPMYNMLLTLLALSVFIGSELNRRGQNKRITVVGVLAALLIITALTINNVIAKDEAFTALAYVIVAAVAMSTLYILLSSPRIRRSS